MYEHREGQYRVFVGKDGPMVGEITHVWRVRNEEYPLLNLKVGDTEKTSVPHESKVLGATSWYWS